MNVYLDTNVLLRFILKDIPTQFKEAEKIISSKNSNNILLPSILFEIEYVLSKLYKKEREEIVSIIQGLLEIETINVEFEREINLAIELFGETNIDFVDCYLYAKSYYSDGKVATFDKDIKKLQTIHKTKLH